MLLENLDGLDAIDLKILDMLSENARTSYVDIGDAVNLSRVAAKSRVQALEEKGIIEQYTVIINPQKIKQAVSIYFEISIDPRKYEEAIEEMLACESITQVYQVTGGTKFHVHAIVADEERLTDLMKNTIYKLPGLVDLYSNNILTRIKDVKNIRL